MTENEREAIEELRDLLEQCNEKEIVSRNLFENIARVLILMEKQENIIKGNECVIETLTNNEKVLLEALEKKDKIIEKRDKLIKNISMKLKRAWTDLEEIKTQFRRKHCELMGIDEKSCWELNKDCLECIKEYFEKKEG